MSVPQSPEPLDARRGSRYSRGRERGAGEGVLGMTTDVRGVAVSRRRFLRLLGLSAAPASRPTEGPAAPKLEATAPAATGPAAAAPTTVPAVTTAPAPTGAGA